MRWKDILNEKTNRRLLLISVFMLLTLMILIRYMNKNHLSELQTSVTSIYQDRLVAKDYIVTISKKFQKKQTSLKLEEWSLQKSIQMNDSINQLIKKYENTVLTDDEESLLQKLKENINKTDQFENDFLHKDESSQQELIYSELNSQYNLILLELEQLSTIQLDEGKKLLDNSYQILASSNNTNQLEIALIIMLMLMIIKIISISKRHHSNEYQQ